MERILLLLWFARSNFQQEIFEAYHDLICFGTACMMIEGDEDQILRFSTRHIKELYIQENDKGFIDTIYRKFKIKTVDGIDDFASMRETVFRRYKRVKDEGAGLPDLILVDGGKGQLSMAVSALRELGLDYLPIVGLAKKLEEVFIPGNSNPQSIHKLRCPFCLKSLYSFIIRYE